MAISVADLEGGGRHRSKPPQKVVSMLSQAMSRPIDILLVEDDPDDVWATQHVLVDNGITNHLLLARDGEEAMAMLRREGEYADIPRPD